MKTADIIKAYVRIREIDNTIPDDVLDFMKQSAINALSHPTTLPSDEEIEAFVTQQPISEMSIEYRRNLITLGAKWMRSLCEAKIAEMEREMKRLEALNKQYSDFRKEVLQIPDELIKEIEIKYFPFLTIPT